MNKLKWLLLIMIVSNGAVAQTTTATNRSSRCLVLPGGAVLAGTAGGLLLYDKNGTRQQLFTAMNGLSGTRVHAIAKFGDKLWVGSDRGVTRFRVTSGRLGDAKQFKVSMVRAIATRGDITYLGTWGQGIVAVSARGRMVVRSGGPRLQRRITSFAWHRESLYAGTAGGGLLKLVGKRFRPVHRQLRRRLIWSLASNGDHLVVATLSGLVKVASSGHVTTIGHADVRVLKRQNGMLWALTPLAGIGRIDSTHRRFTAIPKNAGDWNDWHESANNICLATSRGLFVSRAGKKWKLIGDSAPLDGDVSALAVSGKRLFVGLFDHGLMSFDGNKWRREFANVIDRKVNAVAKAKDGTLWIGTARGLHAIKNGRIITLTMRDGLPSNDIHALKPLRGGGVLVGTIRGAALVGDGPITVFGRKQKLRIGAVWAVGEGPAGRLLIGSTRGLYYRSLSGKWTRLTVTSGHLRDDWITSLVTVSNVVYAGTYNSGVTKLTFSNSGVKAQQLGGGWINMAGLKLIAGHLLAATMNGLLIRKLTGGKWKKIRKAAPGRDVTALATIGQTLWVASRRGLARHKLERFTR